MSVSVLYDGFDLNYFGPTPLVTVAAEGPSSFSQHPHTTRKTRITLEGKIFLPKRNAVYSPGNTLNLPQLVDLESQLRNLFKRQNRRLNIACNGASINFLNESETDGGVICRVSSYSANKSNDNWSFSLDYNIELEAVTPANKPLQHGFNCGYDNPIESYSDEWSIEPIEDTSYYHIQVADMNNPVATNIYEDSNLLKFRVSHRVGAVGMVAPDGLSLDGNYLLNTPYISNHSAFMNAKNFVHCRLSEGSQITDSIFVDHNNYGDGISNHINNNSNQALYLYNHVRTISVSQANGSYDITDTWLALNKQSNYTEDYSVEVSINDEYDYSVRINGSIQGLEYHLTESPGQKDAFKSGNSLSVGDTTDIYPTLNSSTLINENNIYRSKYASAQYGWRNYVEPLLFRRASAVSMMLADKKTTNIANVYSRSNGGLNTSPEQPIGSYSRPGTLQTGTTCSENSDRIRYLALDAEPRNKTVGADPTKGTITYSYEFGPFGFKNNGICNARITSLQVNDNKPANIVAEIFVLGRKRGPILQDTGANSVKTRTLSFEIQTNKALTIGEMDMRFPACPLYTGGKTFADLLNLIDYFRPILPQQWTPVLVNQGNAIDVALGYPSIPLPSGRPCGQVYIKQDDETWNPFDGRFSKTIQWVWE